MPLNSRQKKSHQPLEMKSNAFSFSMSDYWIEFQKLLRLTFPIFIAQLSLTALGVVDTIMSGQVGTDDLAAIGLGSSLLFPVFMVGTGILLALTPLIAKQYGQQNNTEITKYLHQGIWLAIPLGLISMAILMNLQFVLNWLNITLQVYQLIEDYLLYISFGMVGIALYQALRFFWEGLGLTLPTMIISVIALVINIPLNAVFIYGWGPVPEYGAAGCGIASAIVMWVMFLMGLGYVVVSPKTRKLTQFSLKQFSLPNWQQGIQPILGLGVPNTLALLFEVSLFSFIALFIANLGTVVIAAHQVAISYTSLAFMVPLSFALALTVRTGHAYGQKQAAALRLSVRTGIFSSVIFSGATAIITFLTAPYISALYTEDKQVIQLAIVLLGYAAFYQTFDAIQVASAGALRGLHSTQVTMWVTLISYWVIGLGLGAVLAHTNWLVPEMGVEGFWMGIVLGLILAAILLQLKLNWLLKRLHLTGEVV